MSAAGERLRSVLGGHELAWIVERARRRLERGEPLTGTVRLDDPSEPQREAFRRLLGRGQLRGESLVVKLQEIDALLQQAELCDGLADAVAQLTGPVHDLRAARQSEQQAWAALFEQRRRAWSSSPGLLAWLDGMQKSGALLRICDGDLAQAQALLEQIEQLRTQLPADHITLAELAARLFGNAHALDQDEPLGRLALQAAAAGAGFALHSGAEGRRHAWERVGVLVDALSAPLLVLNLRAGGEAEDGTLTARLLQLHATAGEPARLSVRMLLRHAPRFCRRVTGPRVFVCENPSIVAAAADRLGPQCAPLVCLEGQPRTAARLVLRALRTEGITLHYHGDFDWPGIAIANLVLREHAALPWRMSARDYHAARPGQPLSGRPVEPSWDHALYEAMRMQNRAAHEEHATDTLLLDLKETA